MLVTLCHLKNLEHIFFRSHSPISATTGGQQVTDAEVGNGDKEGRKLIVIPIEGKRKNFSHFTEVFSVPYL